MKKDEIQLRFERVLSGGRKSEDLTKIFSFLRANSHGIECIREVGHFAAHQEGLRNQGITWKRAGHIFHNARFFIALNNLKKPREHLIMHKRQYALSINASLELIGPSRIRQTFQLSMEKARKVLASAIEKKILADEGRPQVFSDQEIELLRFVSARFISEPVFTQEILMESLFKVAVKERLMEPRHKPRLLAQSDFIAVYVISIMHSIEVEIGAGGKILLVASVSNGLLNVAARMENVLDMVSIGTPMFMTSCKAAEWADLTGNTDMSRVFAWSVPLELDDVGRLIPMQKSA
jgi:hypothetical protein